MMALKGTAPCIIVDWDTYIDDQDKYEPWLSEKAKHYDVVVLVDDPVNNLFDPNLFTSCEATAVITNSASDPLGYTEFKQKALALLVNGSNLLPVGAIEQGPVARAMLEQEGLLYVW